MTPKEGRESTWARETIWVRDVREFPHYWKHQEVDLSWQFLINFNIYFLHDPQSHLWVFTQEKWKQCPHEHPHANVYSTFIYNYPKLIMKVLPTGDWLELLPICVKIVPQNVEAKYTKWLLFCSFCVSQVWMWLSWVSLVQGPLWSCVQLSAKTVVILTLDQEGPFPRSVPWLLVGLRRPSSRLTPMGFFLRVSLAAGQLASQRANSPQESQKSHPWWSHSHYTAYSRSYIQTFCHIRLLEVIDSVPSMRGGYVRCECLEVNPLGAVSQAD